MSGNKKNKKAYFFSLDALIALIIIVGIVFSAKPSVEQDKYETYVQQDLVDVLSSISASDLSSTYAQALIANGTITDTNLTILEQIGQLYANSKPEAEYLTSELLSSLDANSNVAIYFDDYEIASVSQIPISEAENVYTARQIISGIQGGTASTGYSSRAFLVAENKIDYFYFGGYVGEGNVSLFLGENVQSVEVEGIFSANFDVYINNHYTKRHYPGLTPYYFNLNNYSEYFSSGNNTIEFRTTNFNLLNIGGGFTKVVYNSTENMIPVEKYYIPGIVGFVNYYGSFYVPGNLNSMEVFLDYNSTYDLFFQVGDKEVFYANTSGERDSITLDNAYLESQLDYEELSQKTIPMRFGVRNISNQTELTVSADVYSITDISGSMDASCYGGSFFCCLFRSGCSTPSACSTCSGTWADKIELAIEANKGFIDYVLNYSTNRIGLVAYETGVSQNNTHDLTNDSDSLKTELDEWVAGGSTCICCGINEGVARLLNESSFQSFRSLVVMSDGDANIQCAQQGTGNAKQDAIQAACDAYLNYQIKVYSIGFGEDADESTLQSIASCGNGNYYYGDISDLAQIYEKTAKDIINALFIEQTLVGTGIFSTIFPTSYIKVDYDTDRPYGMTIYSETENFGNSISQGSFNVPENTEPYDVKVISYSGSKWTDLVEINTSDGWQTVFNLSEFGDDFTELGDPFVVSVPLEMISKGDNLIKTTKGASPTNTSGGSEYNKIIYGLVKNVSSYSQITASQGGCNWTIEFEDSSFETIPIPSDGTDNKVCYYTSTNQSYDPNRAIDSSVYSLLSELDLNSNGKIEVKFIDEELTLNFFEVGGLPFAWETEIQVRTWR